ERLEDLPLIARYFLAQYAMREGRKLSISDGALDVMRSDHLPGNVRELRNFIHRTAIMVDDKAIDVDALPPFDAQTVVGAGTVAERYPVTQAEVAAGSPTASSGGAHAAAEAGSIAVMEEVEEV